MAAGTRDQGGRRVTWVRIDENMVDHPKIAGLSDRAFRLWITGLAYANRQETDGHLDMKTTRRWTQRGAKVAEKELVDAGLWHQNGREYVIHDYLEYQPSKADNSDLRAKRAAAGRVGGLRSKPPSKTEASASSLLEAKQKPVPSDQEISTDQEDSTNEGTPAHILGLLHAIGETEHSSAHMELLSWQARGASEHDFREATRAVKQRRPKAPRPYALKILSNSVTDRSAV